MLDRAMLYENVPLLAIGLVLGGAIGAVTVGAIAPCESPAFGRALSRASEAVAIGQQAPQLEPSEALREWRMAEQLWSEALADLALVRRCSQNYDAARERLDSYERYRQQVEREMAKLSAL
ncbi:hypothetical protein [Synechococcus sp. PCC 7336]|uniref:hypothetical protein n=1 Tax=Synechococcus sp. PCC 7336 TaxID=195250 RepID=UPI0003498430|nr:hypothetical protein [Synechococcus sp. PCC 7336]